MGVGEADFQGLPTAMVSILPARPTSCYNRLAVSAESGRLSRLQLTPGRPAFCPLPKDLAACGRGCQAPRTPAAGVPTPRGCSSQRAPSFHPCLHPRATLCP